MQDMYEVYQNTMETCSDIIAPAYNYEGLQCNWRQGKVSAFLTVEKRRKMKYEYTFYFPRV